MLSSILRWFSRVESLNESTGSRGLRKPRSAEISVEQNIYAGGRTVAETEQEFDVLWRRAQLAMEQDVLLDAATAYMNVFRDQAVVDLQKNNDEFCSVN